MDRAAAASLDRWLTTAPEPQEIPLPGEPGYQVCACGAFLRLRFDPALDTHGEITSTCEGVAAPGEDRTQAQQEYYDHGWDPRCMSSQPHPQHEFTEHAWVIHHRICARCGRDNEEADA